MPAVVLRSLREWFIRRVLRRPIHVGRAAFTLHDVDLTVGRGEAVALLGHNEWAARLPSALAYIGTGVLVFGLGRRLCATRPSLSIQLTSSIMRRVPARADGLTGESGVPPSR